MFLHEIRDFADLIAVTARDLAIDPGLIEKDYWIMHGLWGLQKLEFEFELKGGTSLSKGFRLIHRFSEDIDILIHPEEALPVGRNHTKPVHVEARRAFYDALPKRIRIDGLRSASTTAKPATRTQTPMRRRGRFTIGNNRRWRPCSSASPYISSASRGVPSSPGFQYLSACERERCSRRDTRSCATVRVSATLRRIARAGNLGSRPAGSSCFRGTVSRGDDDQ